MYTRVCLQLYEYLCNHRKYVIVKLYLYILIYYYNCNYSYTKYEIDSKYIFKTTS